MITNSQILGITNAKFARVVTQNVQHVKNMDACHTKMIRRNRKIVMTGFQNSLYRRIYLHIATLYQPTNQCLLIGLFIILIMNKSRIVVTIFLFLLIILVWNTSIFLTCWTFWVTTLANFALVICTQNLTVCYHLPT